MNKSVDYSDCLIGGAYPIGEEREAVKLFKLITKDMKEKMLYRHTRPIYYKKGQTECVTVNFNPPESGQSF